MGRLQDKVAIITGGNSGVGAATALLFAKEGAKVVITARRQPQLEEVAAKIREAGGEVLPVVSDISKKGDADKLVAKAVEAYGKVDVLVNNAAIDLSNMFHLKNVEDFKRTLEVNVIGAYNVSLRVYKYMLEQKWGRIINIGSTNGINTYYPMCLEYDASKAALNSLTHNLAIQFAPYINVNCIAPGFIGTEKELEGYDEEFLKQEEEKILVGRYGDPKEVAHLVKFLASDEASFINNSIIRIDGGQYGSN